MKNFIFALAITFVSLTTFAQHQEDSQSQTAKLDTGYCELYMSLNDLDADNYPFNLYLNNQFIILINNGDRLIYKIKSKGKVTISDKGHKPFCDIQSKPGAKYYIEISKKFAGHYFYLVNYDKDSEIDKYLHFVFWDRLYRGSAGAVRGNVFKDDYTTDYRHTIKIEENPANPICRPSN